MDAKKPGYPQCIDITSNCVTIEWTEPKDDGKELKQYELRYKAKDAREWEHVFTDNTLNSHVVKGLRSGTTYDFKVRAIFDDKENGDVAEGPFSNICGNITTKESLSEQIIPNATKVQDGVPTIYKLPLTETFVHEESKTRKCVFKNPCVPLVDLEKTIMVMGETGSGKSTLIDGMVNFLLDVTWEEKCRFTIIDLKKEEKENQKIQSQSQTEWITCYTIESNIRRRIKLNIIDTPGFGDTRGFSRDKELVNQIKHFFITPSPNGIVCLDAVCLVVQSSQSRLTASQQYIFDSVLSLFGKNISENIFVLITFADAETPSAIRALETANIPVKKLFKFNNSALFARPKNSDEVVINKLFWNLGMDNFNQFYTHLLSTEPVSLQLTNEVLQLREDLECAIQALMPQITEGLHTIHNIKSEKNIIVKHKGDIDANKKFEEEVETPAHRVVFLNVGEYITNCLTCNRTCHYPCGIPNDEDKKGCWAIDSTGKCRICPKNCIWSDHRNNQFRYECYMKREKVTDTVLQERYLTACREETAHSNMLGNLKDKFQKIYKKVFTMINDARNCINELKQKAFKQSPLSQADYIELLIKAEEKEAKYGWKDRTKVLRTFNEQAKLMDSINNPEYQPWEDGEVSDLLQELLNA